MKKNIEWLKNEVLVQSLINKDGYIYAGDITRLLNQLDEPDSDYAYQKGFKEGERQTAEYFESVTEEPSYAQVQKYLSEHGIKIADKEPETVADVVTTFWKSYERLKEVMSMEVEELEE